MTPLVHCLMSFLFLCSLGLAQPYTPICKILLDGRIARDVNHQTFDSSSNLNPFNPNYAKGNKDKFSDLISFPQIPPSVFDWQSRPISIAINDRSIYQNQRGVRRTGLNFAANNGNDDITNTGVRTFHWSVHQPLVGKRPLNLTHEYMNVFHVRNDDQGFQFQFTTGELLSNVEKHPWTHWKILDRKEKVIFTTMMDFKEWQNFAVTLDFNKNTMRAYYSKGNEEMKDVTGELQNDNNGRGRFQIGIFKKPINPNGQGQNTYLTSGYQESLEEGDETQIYGGIWVEDSANLCVTK